MTKWSRIIFILSFCCSSFSIIDQKSKKGSSHGPISNESLCELVHGSFRQMGRESLSSDRQDPARPFWSFVSLLILYLDGSFSPQAWAWAHVSGVKCRLLLLSFRLQTTFLSLPSSARSCGPSLCAQLTDRGENMAEVSCGVMKAATLRAWWCSQELYALLALLGC